MRLDKGQREDGIAIITAMAMTFALMVLGGALYWLVTSQIHATELERTDVKAFNVAEAGIDAGMLALKLHWPDTQQDTQQGPRPTVDTALLKESLQATNPGLWDPTRSDPSEFLKVSIYDNVDERGHTSTVPYPSAPTWDSNRDGRMFVDATANVGDDRHRILVMAERQVWPVEFSPTMAFYAEEVQSNGQGLRIRVENGVPPIYYEVQTGENEVRVEDGSYVVRRNFEDFASVLPEATRAALETIARQEGTYFESEAAANEFLESPGVSGKVVYVKSDKAVTIEGNTQIGTPEKPVVLVIDTPDGSINGWDMKGTADFYGVLVTIGNNELRGTSGIHGALLASGTVSNKGTGSCGEINFNRTIIQNVSRQHTLSVNIVPNTWEEYTLPRSSPPSTAETAPTAG